MADGRDIGGAFYPPRNLYLIYTQGSDRSLGVQVESLTERVAQYSKINKEKLNRKAGKGRSDLPTAKKK